MFEDDVFGVVFDGAIDCTLDGENRQGSCRVRKGCGKVPLPVFGTTVQTCARDRLIVRLSQEHNTRDK